MNDLDRDSMIRWIPCFNNSSGEEIPAHAAVRPVSVDEDQILTVAKPNADNQWAYIVGPEPIAASGYGRCTADAPITALYDSGDGTPALDEDWGAENGSYKLAKTKTGFVIQGGNDTDLETTYVRRAL